jgi:FMN phosphatase YigB (HAD superfamily)
MTKLKKEKYVVKVEFNNYNNNDLLQIRFIGNNKNNIVEISDAKIYENYDEALIEMKKIRIKNYIKGIIINNSYVLSEKISNYEGADYFKATVTII